VYFGTKAAQPEKGMAKRSAIYWSYFKTTSSSSVTSTFILKTPTTSRSAGVGGSTRQS